MGYKLTLEDTNILFNELQKEYKIYAPKRFEKAGRYSDTDIIRYDEVTKVQDIVYKEKSSYPPKEVLTPISKTLYYYTGNKIIDASPEDNKKILIFLRPCDINAQKRQDTIFLENGGYEDIYYKRIREKVKFACIECVDGFDTCFCVDMDSNKTNDYSLGVRFMDNQLLFDVKDKDFNDYFNGCDKEEFKLEFIMKNNTHVKLPIIKNKEVLNKLKAHKIWEEYNHRCIECGSCTIACPTCTCYTSIDIVYDGHGAIGERKRVEASCHIPGFDTMAGGHAFRTTAGEKMRYKTLHKIYDYKKRFGDTHMCVGCGRCTDRCPTLISFSATINKTAKAVDEITKEI
ncbi:anaerobic sulfite reductase subunit AsrA [Clostridium sp. D53t1_180928_C8]|uniref:anaerobic sulfite reductase subunit AsrA n=1 Tax=Clostridium sp. D53t1_180928_C8 TaxID=2787101 RepID=UPI0018AAEF41|nr:anaerobic sulfite reductase subunit AsrA [Clostridium sp. D53t1_180928_C8]